MELGHVVVYADDVEETKTFYRETLGLTLEWEEDGIAGFKAGPAQVIVHAVEGYPRTAATCFRVDRIEDAVAELNARGFDPGPVVDEGWGKIARFTDPAGNRLAVFERNPQ